MSDDLHGRSFLITGGNSGIGLATVEVLASRGASVTVASRSADKTQALLGELRTRFPKAALHFLALDLGRLSSVKKSAEEFLATGRPLEVLINNAGIAGASGRTLDGYEITLATNHLGPHLFTQLLLPRLKEAKQARIVNVASRAHRRVRALDLSWFTRETSGTRERLEMYGLSKLMNVIHARELARQLAGTGVTTYALHPGVVASNVWRELPWLVQAIGKMFMLTVEEGARTTLMCATSPELATVTGRYYDQEHEARINRLAEDEALANELFAKSDALIGEALARG
ncbi:MAG: SDR family oxidoreductase [Deltaproteobacteria bacterium]|nr:SDR family oxidoreductase [Deltaproteobacteria bacterium]